MAKPGAAVDEFAPGTILLGKYRIDSILGKGGMGIVALATHLQLEERVAIKFLRPDVVADDEACRRFLREAQAAVKLKSEHVARVSDVGTLENGSPYMVMEYLEGVDLDQMIESSGPVAPSLAVDFMLQACLALAEAHALGIVHRDIKPSNFFVTWRADGSPLLKVLDFGISKAPIAAELSLTKTASVLGTPAYMSPEQMRSARTVDARSDVWSMGTVLYELICGHRPFEAETFSEMCVKVAVDPPAAMTVLAPDGLEAVIMRYLEKDAGQRWQSMAEVARALAPFAHDPRQAYLVVESVQRVLARRPTSGSSGERSEGTRPGATPVPSATPTPPPPPPLIFDDQTQQTPPPVAPPGYVPPRRTTPWGVVSAPTADSASMIASPTATATAPAPAMMMTPAPSAIAPAMNATSAGPAASAAATPWPAPRASSTDASKPRSRRPLVIAIAAIATVAIGAAIVWGIAGTSTSRESTTTSPTTSPTTGTTAGAAIVADPATHAIVDAGAMPDAGTAIVDNGGDNAVGAGAGAATDAGVDAMIASEGVTVIPSHHGSHHGGTRPTAGSGAARPTAGSGSAKPTAGSGSDRPHVDDVFGKRH